MYRYTEAHTSIQLCTTQTETLIHMHIFDTDTQTTNPPTYFLKLPSSINTASTSQLCHTFKKYNDPSKPILAVPGICKIRDNDDKADKDFDGSDKTGAAELASPVLPPRPECPYHKLNTMDGRFLMLL